MKLPGCADAVFAPQSENLANRAAYELHILIRMLVLRGFRGMPVHVKAVVGLLRPGTSMRLLGCVFRGRLR